MCGRFNVIDNPEMRDLLQTLGVDVSVSPGINLAPTEQVQLVRHVEGRRGIAPAQWWLVPAWAQEATRKYAMFNARSETLTQRRAFATPYKRQRGLVPMTHFIEWRTEQGVKQPWLVGNPEGALAVAALWDIWHGGGSSLLSCTLVTTSAAPSFAPWHKRMPVVLAPDERELWLDNERAIAHDSNIFRPELKTPLRLVPLSRTASNARNKDASLLQPAGDVVELAA